MWKLAIFARNRTGALIPEVDEYSKVQKQTSKCFFVSIAEMNMVHIGLFQAFASLTVTIPEVRFCTSLPRRNSFHGEQRGAL